MLPLVYEVVVSSKAARRAFEDSIAAGLGAVGVPAASITEIDIHPGSVLVTVFFTSSQAMAPAKTALEAGKLIISSTVAEPTSTQSVGSGGRADGGSGDDADANVSTALIAAVTAAGLIILLLLVVIVVRNRRSTADRARVGAVGSTGVVGSAYLNPVYEGRGPQNSDTLFLASNAAFGRGSDEDENAQV